jgi:hypothetical protein
LFVFSSFVDIYWIHKAPVQSTKNNFFKKRGSS